MGNIKRERLFVRVSINMANKLYVLNIPEKV
jgi:hypothetical protein